MAFDISYVYSIIDRYTAKASKIARATCKIKDNANKASKSLNKMGSSLTSLSGTLGAAGGIAAIAFPIKKAIDFESVMLDVQKVVKFKTPEQFDKMRSSVFKTAIALGKLPKDIAQIVVQGGKLGTLPKNMNKFVQIVGRTSVAFDMMEGAAAETIGKIKTMLGLTMTGTTKLLDAVNFLADNTSASGSRVIEIIKRTSGTLKDIKMPTQLVAGWAAFADQIEVTPELAASGLNMMIRKMSKMPGMMRKMLKDPSKTIEDYLGKFARMKPERRAIALYKKFGDEAGRFALKAVGRLDLLRKTLKLVGTGSGFAGSMIRELEIKLKGTATALGRIKAVSDFAFIAIGDAFLPAIKQMTPIIVKFVTKFTEFLKANPMITKITIGFTALFSVMTAISIVIGVITTSIGFMLSPAALAIMAISTLGLGVAYAATKSQKLQNAFKRLGESIKPLNTSVSGLLKEFGGVKSIIEAIGFISTHVINMITRKIDEFTLKIAAIKKIVEVVKMPFEFKMREYERWKKIGDQALEGYVSPDKMMKGVLSGRIEVAAERGSRVNSATIDSSLPGNLGVNMGIMGF